SGPLRKGQHPTSPTHLHYPQRSRKDPHPFGFLSFWADAQDASSVLDRIGLRGLRATAPPSSARSAPSAVHPGQPVDQQLPTDAHTVLFLTSLKCAIGVAVFYIVHY